MSAGIRSSRQPATGNLPFGGRRAAAFAGFVATVILLDVALLGWGLFSSFDELRDAAPALAIWLLAAAAIGVATLSFASGSQLGLDAPLLLALGYLFGPIAAGLVAFVGYVDAREFRRQVSLERALFNRAQISLSVMVASAAFQTLGGEAGVWPSVLLAGSIAVGVDMVVNWWMVVAVLYLHDGVRFGRALDSLHFGGFLQFSVTYVAFSLLSVVLAETYLSVGAWSVLVFSLPLVLARQAFLLSHSVDQVSNQVSMKNEALRIASESILDERRDERLAIAAGLHDEVLPPLFKVHMMGQVLRQDLASGQLLALENDVPELVDATQEASDSTRRLIGDLRASPIGTRGLSATLRLLCQLVAKDSRCRIESWIEEVQGSPLVQLLAYQVAGEALRNAIRHSQASRVSVSLEMDGGSLRLIVADDGIGFVPSLVDARSHFGIQLMRERVELAGGLLYIDSSPGAGTRVVLRVPGTR